MEWRHAIAVVLIGATASLFGCDGCSNGAKPSGSAARTSGGAAKGKPTAGAAPAEGAACAGKTCDACVGEAGCWWCKTTNKCTLDKAPGCKVEVNDLSECH